MKLFFVMLSSLLLFTANSQAEIVAKKKAVQVVEISLKMKVEIHNCSFGPYENGDAFVACAYSVGKIPKNGQFQNTELSERYFKTDISIYDDKLVILFTGGTGIDLPDADPTEFFSEVKEYFSSRAVYLTTEYYGPDFDVSQFGQPVGAN